MKQEIIQAVLTALGTILISVIGYLSTYIKSYLKDKEIGQELQNKYYLVKIAVDAVEQMYHEEDGPRKFELAKLKVIQLAKQNGIIITNDEIDIFIEQAVNAMNLKGVK